MFFILGRHASIHKKEDEQMFLDDRGVESVLAGIDLRRFPVEDSRVRAIQSLLVANEMSGRDVEVITIGIALRHYCGVWEWNNDQRVHVLNHDVLAKGRYPTLVLPYFRVMQAVDNLSEEARQE